MGKGEYFFIENSQSMDKVVQIALKGFIATFGLNSKLILKPKDGAKIIKVYGYSNKEIEQGIPLGDLRYNDLRLILIKVEIPNNLNSENEQIFLEYELEYIERDKEKRKVVLKGEKIIKYTDNIEKLEEISSDVFVYQTLQDKIEEENKAQKLVEEGQYDEAINLKSGTLSDFAKLSTHDISPEINNFINVATRRTEETKESIKKVKEKKTEQSGLS